MRVAIYTAIFGGYDLLKNPVEQDIDCDFFCFSDRFIVHATSWNVVVRPKPALGHPRMQAKWFKLMNHRVFPGGRLAWRYGRKLFDRTRYDATIWVDASLEIKGATFAREIATLARGGLAVFAHPDRDCIYEEADVSIRMKKYEGLPVREQVEDYRRAGHPAHAGLFACGVLGRAAPVSAAQATFDEAWWRENKRWTFQDQLSFAALARTMALPIATIPADLWSNDYFNWIPHMSDK